MTNSTDYFRRFSLRIGALAALGLFLLVFSHGDTLAAEARRNVHFDHIKTGFPLTGAHVVLPCESCHVQGTFKGTPKNCETCHTPGSRVRAITVKPPKHIPTRQACNQCHSSTASWKVARFSHVGVTPHQCGQCHNNSIVKGKSAKHMATTASCDTCHKNFTSFTGAVFNHAGVTPGGCASCHNGSQATGKPANHPVTTASCDTCHRTTTWMSASFTHMDVKPGACATCHNGSQAKGKPSNHIPTTLSCDACHTTGGTFTTSRFNHSATQGVMAGQCSNCHNGSYTQWNALGKPANHPVTTASCDTCHSGFQSFTTASSTFNHSGVTPGSCATCHNGSQASGKPANHIPTNLSCDACHGTGTTFTTSTFNHSATQGVVAGQCATCHNGSYTQWNALGKPANHVATTASCDTCHKNYTSFAGATFNHAGVTPGGCATCHNGSQATGKPANHIPTSSSCDACHSTASTFTSSTFNHSATQGVMPGGCNTCHNGAYTQWNALGKPANHVATTASCDSCHTGYTTFAGAGFNHTGVTPGGCATCHNGSQATGKPANHIPTTLSCDACHSTGGTFTTSTFTHSATQGVIAGQCATCHNGSYTQWNALGKPANHVATTASCDTCHKNYTSFAGATFSHTGISPGTCSSCHYQGGPGLGKPTNHIPYESQLLAGASMNCDSCHRSTTSFASQTMNHNSSLGNGSGWCKGCHASGLNYLGGMEKKSLTHEKSTGVTDCSQSGCHRPLGTRGTPYSKW